LITEFYVRTIFEISKNTMNIVQAWKIISEALALEYATFVLIRDLD
jgi:hypothetical protein